MRTVQAFRIFAERAPKSRLRASDRGAVAKVKGMKSDE